MGVLVTAPLCGVLCLLVDPQPLFWAPDPDRPPLVVAKVWGAS